LLANCLKHNFKKIVDTAELGLEPAPDDTSLFTGMSNAEVVGNGAKSIWTHNIHSMFRNYNYEIYSREGKFPQQIRKPVNTHLFINRKSSTLLIALGESWTYCDNMTDSIHSPKGKDRPVFRAEFSFWGHLGRTLNSDVLVLAVPGNNNPYILASLEDAKNELLYNHSYDKVHILYQITSPARDDVDLKFIEWDKIPHLASARLHQSPFGYTSLDSWLVAYDNAVLQQISSTVSDIKNSKVYVWKNFTKWHYDNKPPNINIVPITWTEYLAYLFGIKMNIPDALENEGLYKMLDKQGIKLSKRRRMNLLLTQSQMFDFYKKSSILSPHPLPLAHYYWYQYLLFNTDLYKEITDTRVPEDLNPTLVPIEQIKKSKKNKS